jgi:hypothetical protein
MVLINTMAQVSKPVEIECQKETAIQQLQPSLVFRTVVLDAYEPLQSDFRIKPVWFTE